jgi:hypothetical protein
MNRTLILALTLAATLPLLADEPAAQTKKPVAEKTVADKPAGEKTTSAAEAAPAASQTADSPMVAASKRAKRGTHKSPVITNETLAKKRGDAHVTTTATQEPIPLPATPAKSLDTMRAEKEAKAAVEAKLLAEAREKAAAAEKERLRLAAAAEAGYEGGHGDDAGEVLESEEKPPV